MYISLIQRLVVQFATQFLNNLLLLLLKDGNGASEVVTSVHKLDTLYKANALLITCVVFCILGC